MKSYTDIPAPPLLGKTWQEHALRFTLSPLLVMNELRSYGDIVALVQGGNGALMFPGENCVGTVFVFGPEMNRQILTRTDDFHSGPIIGPVYGAWKSDPRCAILRRVGTGLFSLNGAEHQRQRRLIQPAFHKKQIEIYAQDMLRLANKLVARWSDGQVLDFQRAMFDHTLTVAGKCLFGLDFGESAHRIGDLIQRWLELIPVVAVEALDVDYEAFLDVSSHLDGEIADLIVYKRKHGLGETDVLAELIRVTDEHGGSLTEDELVGHINILLTAGHETTANVLSWTVFLLCQHPDVMAKLYDELEAAFDLSDLCLDKVNHLPYLDAVIRESMRVFPPVTIGSRVTSLDTRLGDYLLPLGTEVVFSHYHTHHDLSLYFDPERFVPERWQYIHPSPYEYLPFSVGTKMCIGAPFALMEIKITLAVMLKRFRFEFVSGSEINRQVWVPLRPNHMPLILHDQDLSFDESVGLVRGDVLDMVSLWC